MPKTIPVPQSLTPIDRLYASGADDLPADIADIISVERRVFSHSAGNLDGFSARLQARLSDEQLGAIVLADLVFLLHDLRAVDQREALLELRARIVEGRISGRLISTRNEHSELCGCIIGTVAYAVETDETALLRSSREQRRYTREEAYDEMPLGAELVIGDVSPGDTPQSRRTLRVVLEVVDTLLAEEWPKRAFYQVPPLVPAPPAPDDEASSPSPSGSTSSL